MSSVPLAEHRIGRKLPWQFWPLTPTLGVKALMTRGRIRSGVDMSEVQLLDIGEIEQEVFTRWDITGHQVNRHLLGKALTGTDDVVLDHLTFPPVSSTTCTDTRTRTWSSSR
jgi:hypothetical protein